MEAATSDNAGWFWKLFGTAIIGIITMLLLNNLNNISNNIYNVKSEVNSNFITFKNEIEGKIAKSQTDLQDCNSKINKLEASMSSFDVLIKQYQESSKERLTSIETGLKERTKYSETNVNALREADKELAKQISDLREKMILFEEKIAKLKETTIKHQEE